MCDTLGRDTWLACPRISDSPTSFVLLPSPFLSLYCNVQNIGRCRRTSKSYESVAAGAEREGEREVVGWREVRETHPDLDGVCTHAETRTRHGRVNSAERNVQKKKFKKKKQRKKLRQVYFPSFSFFFFFSYVSLFSSNFFLFFPLLLSLSLSHTEHFALFTACAARRLQVMSKRGTARQHLKANRTNK